MIGSICSLGTNSTTSISRLRSAGSDLRSASVMTTVSLAVVVRLVDVLVRHDLAVDLADALVPDAPAVGRVHLVQ